MIDFLLKYNEIQNTLDSTKNQYKLAKERLRIMLGESEDVNVLLPEVEVKELIVEELEKLIADKEAREKRRKEIAENRL